MTLILESARWEYAQRAKQLEHFQREYRLQWDVPPQHSEMG